MLFRLILILLHSQHLLLDPETKIFVTIHLNAVELDIELMKPSHQICYWHFSYHLLTNLRSMNTEPSFQEYYFVYLCFHKHTYDYLLPTLDHKDVRNVAQRNYWFHTVPYYVCASNLFHVILANKMNKNFYLLSSTVRTVP